ncbi:hypothetical protein [Flavobacterium sp. HNIBRBA15423]|uniref:hypothetical protein n=1 Tax=Flavobacterium sp. HNIBRBA15423 TaxID=3458683 RepID=UPI004044BE74
MKKSILNLQGVQELSKNEKKNVNGSVAGACRGLGETGQMCSTHSDCTGSGNPVCYKGCCNILV